MKRFIIDFILAFLIIVAFFGMSGSSNNNVIDEEKYDSSIIVDNGDIENIKDYDGNLVNRISFKINGIIQGIADFGFDIFKKAIKSFLE